MHYGYKINRFESSTKIQKMFKYSIHTALNAGAIQEQWI